MLTVNTNTGAMVALQYLNQTNAQLQTTQNAINSGLKVASAKDDGATFAIAQDMRGDVAGYSSVTDSLNRGISSVDTALSRGQSISDLLIEMKQKALSASDQSLDTASPPGVERGLHGAARPDHLHHQQCRVQRLQPGGRLHDPDHRAQPLRMARARSRCRRRTCRSAARSFRSRRTGRSPRRPRPRR